MSTERSIYLCDTCIDNRLSNIKHIHVVQPLLYELAELKEIIAKINQYLQYFKTNYGIRITEETQKVHNDFESYLSTINIHNTYTLAIKYMQLSQLSLNKYYHTPVLERKSHDELLESAGYTTFNIDTIEEEYAQKKAQQVDAEKLRSTVDIVEATPIDDTMNTGLSDDIRTAHFNNDTFTHYICYLASLYMYIVKCGSLLTVDEINSEIGNSALGLWLKRINIMSSTHSVDMKFFIKMNTGESFKEFKDRMYQEIVRLLDIYIESDNYYQESYNGKTTETLKKEFENSVLKMITYKPCKKSSSESIHVDTSVRQSLEGGYSANIKRLEAKYKKYKSKYLKLKKIN